MNVLLNSSATLFLECGTHFVIFAYFVQHLVLRITIVFVNNREKCVGIPVPLLSKMSHFFQYFGCFRTCVYVVSFYKTYRFSVPVNSMS